MSLCSFQSLRQLHLKLGGYPNQESLATICTNLVNLRELLIDIPFLSEEKLFDNFCNMQMHHPRAKRYLRLYELFAHETPMKIVSNKEEFIRKYVKVYPSHLKFEEKFTKKYWIQDLFYFLRIPSFKHRIAERGTELVLTLKDETFNEVTRELEVEI